MTVESRDIDHVLDDRDKEETKTAMEDELYCMSMDKIYPKYFCRILQNGANWIFIIRVFSQGRCRWYCLQPPPTIINGVISHDNCLVLSKVVESVLANVDTVIDSLVTVKRKRLMRWSREIGRYCML